MTPADKPWTDLLRGMSACSDAVAWADTQPDLATAWERCERADWMLWLAARLHVPRPAVVLAACACARTALRHVPSGEDRPRIAIETAERWSRGEATIRDVRAAAYAADAADDVADAYAAYTAAYDAYAAYAAYDAASYASLAAYAAYADAAAAAAARITALRQMAPLVREHIPAAMIVEAAERRTS